MLSKTSGAAVLAAGALALTLSAPAFAQDPGVHPDRIVLGQSAALDGPASALGTGMRLGLEAAFAEANAAGGVHGRKIELKTYDDGYEPDRAIENTRRLIEDDAVFALIGEVGTPTSKAVQPMTTEAGVPFVAPFTGAGFLRDTSLGNVVNVRASYDEEAETWIRHLTDEVGAGKIAILYQDDSFGRAGLSGVNKALEKRGMSLVAEGTYQRNTTAVKSALLDIRKADPDAVVMVGAYKPIAEFVKLAKKLKMDPTFVTISFVGSNALAGELGDQGEGVLITQVVPLPEDASVPLVAAYHAALKAVDPSAKAGFVSLEGYIAGRLAVAALDAAGPEPTRAAFLESFGKIGSFDLGGITLTFGADDNQGMDTVYLTRIGKGGQFESLGSFSM